MASLRFSGPGMCSTSDSGESLGRHTVSSRSVQSAAVHLHCRGLQQLRMRQFEAAHQSFVAAVQGLREYQDNRNFLLCLVAVTKVAECKWHLKRYVPCIELCNFVLRKVPQGCKSVRYQALLLRGLAYQPVGQVLLAITDLELAFELAPPSSRERLLTCIAVIQSDVHDYMEPACSSSNSHVDQLDDGVTQHAFRGQLCMQPTQMQVSTAGYQGQKDPVDLMSCVTWSGDLMQEHVDESRHAGTDAKDIGGCERESKRHRHT